MKNNTVFAQNYNSCNIGKIDTIDKFAYLAYGTMGLFRTGA